MKTLPSNLLKKGFIVAINYFLRENCFFRCTSTPHISNYRELFLIPFFYVLVLQKKKCKSLIFISATDERNLIHFSFTFFFASRFPPFVMMKQREKLFEVEEFSLIISRLTNTFLSKRRNNVIELPVQWKKKYLMKSFLFVF